MGLHLNPCQDMIRVLLALSPALLGVSRADDFLNNLLPDVDFDHEDCKGDTCFPTNQLLHLDRVKTGKLTYNERSVAYASTQNILAACLPGVAMEAVAESFLSCKDKKMEEICTFAKRGWLVKDSKEETVPNLDLLTSSFGGLKGGAEAVKKCMKVKEEAESLYDYYYDEYDYMEEGEGMEVRRKREAGRKPKKNNQQSRQRSRKQRRQGNRNSKKAGNRANKRSSKGGKNSKGKKKGKKNKGQGGNRNNKPKSNPKKKGKGKEKKSKNNGNKRKNERKYVNKKPDKEPSKENEEKIKNRLAKLGLTKMPTPSTLSGLECLWDELENLLVACAENIASTNP